MTPSPLGIRDGVEEIRSNLPTILAMIVRTARWVHPDVFHALPVWYPESARGQPIYDAKYRRQYTNTDRETHATTKKREPNIKAAKALIAALGAKKTPNWTVCHIWGVDDPTFQKSNRIVRDPCYYSCVGNMVWLPTPLKAFTDAMPEIKAMLRTCAFHLYGWACEHEDVANEARKVRSGPLPTLYPKEWPTSRRRCLPPGTAPFSDQVKKAIEKRKRELRERLGDRTLANFPRNQIRRVMRFWKIEV